MGEGLHTMRTGLELVRASQLTMLRLQLALHRSNRRTAMQALDTLLDIDAEMEGLAATLSDAPAHPANDAALSGFIGLQKAAIAAEKHALTGGDWPSDGGPMALSAPGGWADNAAQPLFPDDEAEDDDRTRGRRWTRVLAVALVAVAVACGLIAYLAPTLPAAVMAQVTQVPLMQRL
jgi:hypothetical protein